MKENKGFSLVELIVVVAIMAVLVGILAPAYLSYVEKTRIGADEDAAEEIRRAVETAAAEVAVYDSITTGNLTFGNNVQIAACTDCSDPLKASLKDVFGEKKFETKSKKYKGKSCIVTITSTAGGTSGLTAYMFSVSIGGGSTGGSGAAGE